MQEAMLSGADAAFTCRKRPRRRDAVPLNINTVNRFVRADRDLCAFIEPACRHVAAVVDLITIIIVTVHIDGKLCCFRLERKKRQNTYENDRDRR